MKEVAIKLPNTEKGLKHSLRLNEIADEEEINYTNFEHKLKSVLYLYNIDTIKIEAPLNIFYLNLYLNLLILPLFKIIIIFIFILNYLSPNFFSNIDTLLTKSSFNKI